MFFSIDDRIVPQIEIHGVTAAIDELASIGAACRRKFSTAGALGMDYFIRGHDPGIALLAGGVLTLVWYFFGYSKTYAMFLACGELAAGCSS